MGSEMCIRDRLSGISLSVKRLTKHRLGLWFRPMRWFSLVLDSVIGCSVLEDVSLDSGIGCLFFIVFLTFHWLSSSKPLLFGMAFVLSVQVRCVARVGFSYVCCVLWIVRFFVHSRQVFLVIGSFFVVFAEH